MRFPRVLLPVLLASSMACQRVDDAGAALDGRWEGELTLGAASQPLVVDVHSVIDGLRVVVRVPSQLRTDSTAALQRTATGVELVLGGEREPLVFAGARRGDELVLAPVARGAGAEAAEALRLRLVRRGAVPSPSVRSETLQVASDVGPLAAELVLPVRGGPHPAIVLVHGSGQSPRQALLSLAEHFAGRGIAALAYDKRPITVHGNEELTRGEVLAADAQAAVRLLAQRPDIRPDRIGLWGGSQGSGVAAMAATQSKNVAFVVSVSGGGIAYTPFVQYQTAHRLRARGLPEAVIVEAIDLIRARHEYLRNGGDSARLEAQLEAARARLQGTGMPLDVPSTAEREAWTRAGYLEGDAADVWRGVRVPVLALWGARDEVVPPEPSAAAVWTVLQAAGNADATVCILPGADHGMQLPAGPGAGPGGTFAFPALAPAYLDGMIAWVQERVRLTTIEPSAAILAGCTQPR